MKIYKAWFCVLLIALSACSPEDVASALKLKSEVAVSIHGVNYTSEPFEYVVVDPKDESNSGGGEHIGPYSAGGIVCCFTLPKAWKADLKIAVHETFYRKIDKTQEISEVKKVHIVEIPPYAGGKVGELWVIRTSNGDFEVVSSDVQPDHPGWPGKVKGGPVPSREYRLQRWELYRKTAEENVATYRELLAELNSDTKKRLNDQWKFSKEHYDKEIDKFSGPEDPAYEKYLRVDYMQGLNYAEDQLKQLEKTKP